MDVRRALTWPALAILAGLSLANCTPSLGTTGPTPPPLPANQVPAGASVVTAQDGFASSIPPQLEPGKTYDVQLVAGGFDGVEGRPHGGSLSIHVMQPGPYAFSLPADVPLSLSPVDVNDEIRKNPPPTVIATPVAGGWTIHRATLQRGWYFLALGPAAPKRATLVVAAE